MLVALSRKRAPKQRQTDRQTEGKKSADRQTETDRSADRPTDRLEGKETGKQT